MKILSTNGDFLELTLEVIHRHCIYEADFGVRLNFEGFTGTYSTAFEEQPIRNLIEQLKQLERVRHGQAEIDSMSPGELKFTIGALDNMGHIGTWGQLSRWSFDLFGQRFEQRLMFGFAFERPRLCHLINAFQALLLPKVDPGTWNARWDEDDF